MTDLIRVLVVDDHLVVREGLCALLIPYNGMEVVGEAADGAEAIEKARLLQPDVILMDLNLPVKSGLEAIAEITQENPQARILVLTSYEEKSKLSAAIQAGSLGYLSKNSLAQELFHAIRGVAMGKLSVSPDATQVILQNLHLPDNPAPSPISTLTERELDVLRGLAQGQSDQKLAETLNIEKTTVRTHIKSILNKLDLDNRTQGRCPPISAGT